MQIKYEMSQISIFFHFSRYHATNAVKKLWMPKTSTASIKVAVDSSKGALEIISATHREGFITFPTV